MSEVHRVVQFIQPFVERFGGPGLALVGLLDSSFVPMPADVMLVLLVIQHPARWVYYAVATTVGSVGGAYILYAIGRKGGEAVLRKRVHERHLEWGLNTFRRYGLLAIVVSALAPPPMPFKVFVLLAGVSEVAPGTFILAMALGRGLRYTLEALMTFVYGRQATDYARAHLPALSAGLAAVILLATLGVIAWRRRRAGRMKAQDEP